MDEKSKKSFKNNKETSSSCTINLSINQIGLSLIGFIEQKTVEFFYINMD